MQSSEVSETTIEFDDFGLVKNYVCPSCGSQVKLSHTDDVGTKFFKCEKCGQVSSRLRTRAKTELVTNLKNVGKRITLDELNEILESTIKRDESSKLIAFLNMLLTYTEESQQNLAFKAESSTGKSYIPIELANYFPENDVLFYAYASPTAFFHDYGVWDKEKKIVWLSLKKKILVFLDQPHDLLLQRLRPLLSHDKQILSYKITDRREKHGLRTKTVEIEGYPTVVFCSAKQSIEDQEKTRLFLLSPETTQDKLKASLALLAKKLGNRVQFYEELKQDPRREWLKNRVAAIRNRGIHEIIVANIEEVYGSFLEERPFLQPRHQRDFPRLVALIKACALLNCFSREEVTLNGQRCIKANEEDVYDAFKLYNEIVKPNELGISPEIFEIFERVIQSNARDEGLLRSELQSQYFKVYHRPLSDKRLSEILQSLAGAGLINEEPDPNDKRYKRVFLTIYENKSPGSVGCIQNDEKIDPAIYSRGQHKNTTPQSRGIYYRKPYDTRTPPIYDYPTPEHKISREGSK